MSFARMKGMEAYVSKRVLIVILALVLDRAVKAAEKAHGRVPARSGSRRICGRSETVTINQAIRILDPATTAEELATIEYYGGLHGREKMVAACDEACRMAVRIMRKYLEEQK